MRGLSELALVALAAALLALLLTACGGSGAGGPSAAPTPGPPLESATPSVSPARTTVAGDGALAVYLLGGSSARECVVSNADWTAQLRRLLDRQVRAVDLGATSQSFTADRRLVRNMADGPTVVVIGISLGRYTSPPPQGLADNGLTPLLERALAGAVEVEHGYSESRAKTVEHKERLLAIWLAERYPLYRKNFAANQAELELLLRECRERGFFAVVLELPLNLEIVGDDFDTPRATYAEDCQRLAVKYQVPYVSFVDELRLPDAEFYDLMHLTDSGRAAWQERLSREIARLLDAAGETG